MSRRKVGAALLILAVFVGVTLVVLRLVAGALARSDDFRDLSARLMERVAGGLMLQPLITVGASDLTGLMTLELSDIKILSARDPSVHIIVSQAALAPDFSNFESGTAVFDGTMTLADGGSIQLDISVPLDGLRPKPLSEARVLATFDDVGARTLGNLALDSLGLAGVRVMSGAASGRVTMDRTTGEARVTLTGCELALAADEARRAKIAPTEIDLRRRGDRLELVSPLALEDDDGRATLTGWITVADVTSAEITVETVGAPQFAGALPRILGCESDLAAPRYQVSGPLGRGTCAVP